MDSLQAVVARLYMLRLEQGLTQADVARQVGIDPSLISNLETGKTLRPPYEYLVGYAAAVGYRLELQLTSLTSPAAPAPVEPRPVAPPVLGGDGLWRCVGHGKVLHTSQLKAQAAAQMLRIREPDMPRHTYRCVDHANMWHVGRLNRDDALVRLGLEENRVRRLRNVARATRQFLRVWRASHPVTPQIQPLIDSLRKLHPED